MSVRLKLCGHYIPPVMLFFNLWREVSWDCMLDFCWLNQLTSHGLWCSDECINHFTASPFPVWGKCFLGQCVSCDEGRGCNTRCGHYIRTASQPVPEGLVKLLAVLFLFLLVLVWIVYMCTNIHAQPCWCTTLLHNSTNGQKPQRVPVYQVPMHNNGI